MLLSKKKSFCDTPAKFLILKAGEIISSHTEGNSFKKLWKHIQLRITSCRTKLILRRPLILYKQLVDLRNKLSLMQIIPAEENQTKVPVFTCVQSPGSKMSSRATQGQVNDHQLGWAVLY